MAGSTIHSIAVSPLDNLSGDPEQEYFADAMTDELITHLAKIGALRVTPRSSVMGYKKERKSLPDIAKELHVNTLVGGSVSRSGSQVQINVKLVHATPAQSSWEKVFASDLGDVSALHNQIAREIAQQIKVVVTPQEQALLTSAQKVNPKAFEAYLHGSISGTSGEEAGYKNAIDYFKQAIDDRSELCAGLYRPGSLLHAAGDIRHRRAPTKGLLPAGERSGGKGARNQR